MKNVKKYFAFLSFIIPLFFAGTVDPQTDLDVLEQLSDNTAHTKKTLDKPKDISKDSLVINYQDEPLVNVINDFASLKGVNIILPQGAQAIKEKITYQQPEKLNLPQAWDLLLIILDIAGYTVVPKGDDYTIVKNSKNIAREPLPLYINTELQELPDTDERIRYLRYFSNVKVTKEADAEFNKILKELLPADATFQIDMQANAIITTAKSNDIKAVMRIIAQLDEAGFQETLEIIHLEHSSARIVADLFNQQILKTVQPTSRYRLDAKKDSDVSYFSLHTRVIPETRTNSLIVVGKSQAVNRIKNFIEKYIDVELQSGKSILHVYQLQYLDANEFAPILQRIVTSEQQEGTGQARAGTTAGGTERFFEGVIIKTDTTDEAPVEGEGKYYGGNKLIIAARNDDWQRIKKLIEDLDTPQRQVLIEVLIADLTTDDSRIISGFFRNPRRIPLPNDVNIQSAQASPPGVMPDSWSSPQTIGVLDKDQIASDLLRLGFDSNGNRVDDSTDSATIFAPAGSTVMAFNDDDGKTWGILQFLQRFGNTKILSNPHIIATHNQEAVIEVGQDRLVPGEAAGSQGGTVTQRFESIQANLNVRIVPLISGADTVNLQLLIDIDEFIEGSNARVMRDIITNANVNSGDILAIGGLVRTNVSQGISRTPILHRIPVLGWFFKRRSGLNQQNNLTVFISPTIIEPRLRRGVGVYTRDYVELAKSYAEDSSIFGALRDPISRWFFKTDIATDVAVDDFIAKDKLQFELEKEYDLAEQEVAPSEDVEQDLIDLERAKMKRERAIEETTPQQNNQTPTLDKKKEAEELKQRLAQETENPFKKDRTQNQVTTT